LLLVCAADLYWTFSHLPPYVSVTAPWLLLAPLVLMLGVSWLARSRRLPLIFAEWPEDKSA
jgi:hypothetical protein